jgi:hypothetical protein
MEIFRSKFPCFDGNVAARNVKKFYSVGIHKAESNTCSIGFTKLICTVASEKDRFGPFDK